MHLARYKEYVSPFTARYVSAEMSQIFSQHFKISTFRKLWAALAKAEQSLGLPITHQQIAELEDNVDKIDFEAAHLYEKKFRHDVMAHIHAYADQCPSAKPIIHLGATSSYVTDNTDLIQLKAALQLLLQKLIYVMKLMKTFVEQEAATPCLGFTHFQPAQPTTIGKRGCLWLQDLLMDAKEWEKQIESIPFLGVKGATGTQASFLTLFENDEKKVQTLEEMIAKDFGFTKVLPIAAQTYTRKIDLNILNALESFAASCHKIATDIRLLAHENEIMEVFTETQVGSSAMPFKRNPIYSERICGLARFVMSLAQNPAYTVATQWLERSLDDSSNRRLSIAESFLGVDAILNLLSYIFKNIQVHRANAEKHLEKQIPHLAMESILMKAVKQGQDRQEVHEKLRTLSDKPLQEIIKELHLDPKEFSPLSLTGRAADQVREFIKNDLLVFLDKYKDVSTLVPEIEI